MYFKLAIISCVVAVCLAQYGNHGHGHGSHYSVSCDHGNARNDQHAYGNYKTHDAHNAHNANEAHNAHSVYEAYNAHDAHSLNYNNAHKYKPEQGHSHGHKYEHYSLGGHAQTDHSEQGHSHGHEYGHYSLGGHAQTDHSEHGHVHHVDYYAHPKYNFKYGVSDKHTHDHHSQHESRDGDKVHGEYSLHEADGTIRIVKYTSDHKNGFNAEVIRKGHAVHPETHVKPAFVAHAHHNSHNHDHY